MKRLTIALLVLLLLFLAACGGKKPDPAQPVKPAGLQGSAPPPTSSAEQTAEPTFEGELYELNLFSVVMPDGWTIKYEEPTNYETYCNQTFVLKQGEETLQEVYFSVGTESVRSFRKELIRYGLDLRQVAAGQVTDMVDFGGLSFYHSTDTFGKTIYDYYVGRDIKSGVTVYITSTNAMQHEDGQNLINSLRLVLKDVGNNDAPWPWDGQPYRPVTANQSVGSYTISAQFLPVEPSLVVNDIFDNRAAMAGGSLYILHGANLTKAAIADTGVIPLDDTIQLEEKCTGLSYDNTGMLWVSPGYNAFFGMKDLTQTVTPDIDGTLAMDPSGAWGLVYRYSSDVEKVTVSGGSLTSEPWALTNLPDDALRQGPFTSVNHLSIGSDHVIVTGRVKDTDDEGCFVFDKNGNVRFRLEGPTIGSISAAVETKNGFLLVDGNMRDLHYFAKDGSHIGTIECDDLLGTDYPWLSDARLLDSGRILLVASQERADLSADELLFYLLDGF